MQQSPNGLARVLVVMAHPDDAEFGAAGTVAKWAKEGRQVTYLILTDGNRGSNSNAGEQLRYDSSLLHCLPLRFRHVQGVTLAACD